MLRMHKNKTPTFDRGLCYLCFFRSEFDVQSYQHRGHNDRRDGEDKHRYTVAYGAHERAEEGVEPDVEKGGNGDHEARSRACERRIIELADKQNDRGVKYREREAGCADEVDTLALHRHADRIQHGGDHAADDKAAQNAHFLDRLGEDKSADRHSAKEDRKEHRRAGNCET